MRMIGHNNGPTMEPGTSWRTHCWQQARRSLLKTVPIEIVRSQMVRARELGLNYKTYASIRAESGQDVVAFLFSTNALRLLRSQDVLAPEAAEQLEALQDCGRLLAVNPPLPLPQNPLFSTITRAPAPFAPWAEMRQSLREALGKFPSGGVVLVGAPEVEREWVTAGKLAAYLPASRYFSQETQHG